MSHCRYWISFGIDRVNARFIHRFFPRPAQANMAAVVKNVQHLRVFVTVVHEIAAMEKFLT
jgi:hypothetical protein